MELLAWAKLPRFVLYFSVPLCSFLLGPLIMWPTGTPLAPPEPDLVKFNGFVIEDPARLILPPFLLPGTPIEFSVLSASLLAGAPSACGGCYMAYELF